MTGRQIGGLVLAAGSGSRLGRPKALVEVGDERLVDRAVRTLRDGGAEPIVVVLGAALAEVAGAVVVENPDWATGMGSSLRVGLAALPTDGDAVVVSLVDQPDIGPAVVARLIDAFAAGATVAVASYSGKRGNPVLFARSTWDEVAALAKGDVGARPFLAAHPELVTPVPCDDIADPADIDTPADLARKLSTEG
ncbi:MAG TPA: nucleotidyltransferase family protein [Sporichthyaceae bacterium]|jgi:nicotine blue oxidoreductase|nr:nucleotidyltransferase family protein [Sporichthyaceae bacterium]